jgi:hypothetical protein
MEASPTPVHTMMSNQSAANIGEMNNVQLGPVGPL